MQFYICIYLVFNSRNFELKLLTTNMKLQVDSDEKKDLVIEGRICED